MRILSKFEMPNELLATLLGLAACSAPLSAFPQSLTVTLDATSAVYDVGTEFDGFKSQTNNPLGPFAAAGVQFAGTNAGGNEQIYRYRLAFDEVVQLGWIVMSGAAWEGDSLILQDELGIEIANLAVDSFGNNFQSVLLDLAGISGQIFYLEERNSDPTWRFRNLISVALSDGSSPEVTLGTTADPPPLFRADWPDGNGHVYMLVELPGSDWDTARSHVLENFPGFDLATISNRAEQVFVELLAARTGTDSQWWLGGFQPVSGGGSSPTGWAWVTGQLWEFENWAPAGRPAPGTDSHLAITAGSDLPNWVDPGASLNGVGGYIAESLYSRSALDAAGLAGTLYATSDEVFLNLWPSDTDCIDHFYNVHIVTPTYTIRHRVDFSGLTYFGEEAIPAYFSDSFERGEELRFAIPVCGGDVLDILSTGPAERSNDGFVHAVVTPFPPSNQSSDHAWIIAFAEQAGATTFRDVVFEVGQAEPFDKLSTSVGSLPAAVDDTETTPAGVGVAIDVLRNDLWLTDSPIAIEIALVPANGAAFVASSDYIAYSPRAGFVGVDIFKYRITDRDGDSSTATVTVTVTDSGGSDDDGFVLFEPPEFPANGGGGALSLLFVVVLATLTMLRRWQIGRLIVEGDARSVIPLLRQQSMSWVLNWAKFEP